MDAEVLLLNRSASLGGRTAWRVYDRCRRKDCISALIVFFWTTGVGGIPEKSSVTLYVAAL